MRCGVGRSEWVVMVAVVVVVAAMVVVVMVVVVAAVPTVQVKRDLVTRVG